MSIATSTTANTQILSDAGAIGATTAQKSTKSKIRVSRKEIVELTTQLSIMIRTGVDVASALQSCARQARKAALRSMLEDIHDLVLSGSPMSEALKHYANIFGETYVASIAAGEASGKMPEVLAELAKMERNAMRLKGSIRTMLAYPIMLGGVSSLVLAALVLFVLPQFAEIFEQFEMPLPMTTQLLIGMSMELKTRFWLWVPLALGIGGGLFAFKRTDKGKAWWDWLLLYSYFLRDISRNLQIGRVCRLWGIMIESGVPMLESLKLAKLASTSVQYRELFAELEDDVINGRGLAAGLQRADFIPPGAAEMLVTAEQTGTMGVVTEIIGAHYEEEGENKLKEIVTLLEPAITVGMGIVIAVVVSSVMLPMFDMAQVSSGH